MTDEAEDAPATAAENPPSKGKPLIKLLLVIAALVVGLVGWNAPVYLPVSSALADESDASMIAYRRWLISPSEIVIDVRSVEGSHSMAGMDRMLFKSAEALKDSRYQSVVLAYKGAGRFRLDGAHFQEVGSSFSYENPVYLMRTLTENVSTMDGSPAFGTWTGGLIGVLGEQLNDHNEFHEKWWVRPAMGLE